MDTVPEHLKEFVESVVNRSRDLLPTVEDSLPPVVFIGNSKTGVIEGAPVNMADNAAKNRTSLMIKLMAAMMGADTVLLVSESWKLPESLSPEEAEAAMEKYGQVMDYPGRVECMMFILETDEGNWAATPEIVNRSFGEVQFLKMEGSTGRFTNFLPRR